MIISSSLKGKKLFYKSVIIVVVITIIFVLGFLVMKYEVEGESLKDMPFKLSSITIASTADGKRVESEEKLWNIDIFQVNDIYFKIEKNEEKNEILKSVSINNVKVLREPLRGNIRTTQILKTESGLNKYTGEQLNELIYIGAKTTSLENLTIANQGGTIGVRFLEDNLANYNSDVEEIVYDGTLLSKAGIVIDEIKFSVSFDMTIELENKIKYKANVVIDLPEEDIITNGMSVKEIKDLEKIVFKRV